MARTNRGARAPQRQRYPSLGRFYDADLRRLRSREVDVGLWWRQGSDGPLHRAAWVSDTGELYLVRLGAPAEGGGRVEVLARTDSRESLDDVLRGWQDQCGRPRSLSWLYGRAAKLRARVRPAGGRSRVAAAGTA